MAVKLYLTSGEQRIVPYADGARVENAFFIVTRWHPDLQRTDTVLTLLAANVLGAEVEKDGVVTDYVRGGAGPTETN